jgi:phosphoribosyl 1,2-cyclic phosphate phosphodiesterase
LREDLDRLDAVLFTHAHADHVLGLDDVRPFNATGEPLPIYGNRPALDGVRRIFQYAFNGSSAWAGSVPLLDARVISGPVELFGLTFDPIPVLHGQLEVLGFRFGPVAYLTDYNQIPEPSAQMLRGLDVVFFDALRHMPHPAHMTVQQALEEVQRIQPKQAYLTHIAHDLGHEETNRTLPEQVRLCYDGMQVAFET